MKSLIVAATVLSLMFFTGCSQTTTEKTSAAGPNGGDLVSIKSGKGYAEFLTNADTGEVLVNTWDKDLKTRQPIEREPITVGSGNNSVELAPHPMDSDPSGTCSRFYGHADWVRGGNVRHGWMHGVGIGDHQEFEWQHCWQGGRTHGRMWEEMGKHRQMGPGHHRGTGEKE